MPRGVRSPIGTETVNANGYCQVKTERGWVGKHTLILEKKLGRQLLPGERAVFKDGNKQNLDPANIELAEAMSTRSVKARIVKLQQEVEDRLALIKELEKELANADE
jgi:hypothetical protein